MKVLIAGAGPVSCLLATKLRGLGFEVDVFERRPDVRRHKRARGHSFNLTLTWRGLRWFDENLRVETYRRGVQLDQRVVHHVDGSVSYQPYGRSEEHHLLSIPRSELHLMLLDAAERSGARLHFENDCLAANPATGRLTVSAASGIRHFHGDLLVGCDGAASVVRQELLRHGGPMRISQDYLPHGYLELRIPAAPGGRFALQEALRDTDTPESDRHGMHIWPRDELMLIAQPNVDSTYTATLFMPLETGATRAGTGPAFDRLPADGAATELFAKHFSDVVEHLPDLDEQFREAPPALLRTLRCSRYHQERAVLLGDAAHTMVPFYGQGINCSFEDVGTLVSILERHVPTATGAVDQDAIATATAEFTELRLPAGEAITDLSLANLRELSAHTGELQYHAHSALEKQLHRADPDRFMPLYDMVAFTAIPYHEAVRRHERTQPVVDGLVRQATGEATHSATSSLVLDPEQSRDMLVQLMERLDENHRALASGKLPASYLHGAHADHRVYGGALRQDEPPSESTALPELLDDIFDRAARDGMVHPHPGFLAQVPSGGLFQSAVGDFIGRALNRFVSVHAAAPGMVSIETSVIRWYCTILGYGTESFGYLTTGGSIANLMAIRCALTALGDREADGLIYTGAQGHYSVVKAARLAGVSPDRVRTVPSRPDLTIDLAKLSGMLAEDRAANAVPALVVGTAGTTNSGAVDDLAGLADVCGADGVRLHVDACLGGFFRLTDRGRELLAGIEEADSISVDAHKSLFLPHGSSALLVRRQTDLHAAFAVPGATYIPELAHENDAVDLCNYGPELTRETRGLGAWLPLRMHGLPAFARCLDSCLDLADRLAARLATIDGIEVIPRGRPHLPVVAFRVAGPDGAALNAATRQLCEQVCASGRVYLATTELPAIRTNAGASQPGTVVRACILHPRTDEAVIDGVIDEVRTAMATQLANEAVHDVAGGVR